MRTWEFDDVRAIPTDLVLEQDFILRIRRLNRMETPYVVTNFLISEIPADFGGRGTLDDAQNRLQSIVLAQKGSYAAMTRGDVFLMWPKSERCKEYLKQAIRAALPEGSITEALEKYTVSYEMPEDYGKLRERAGLYIELSKIPISHEDNNAPARLLHSDAARGPLTAWSVNQVERLAKEIDLRPFIRAQSVYQIGLDKVWKPIFDESFMGLADMKQAHFPHLEVTEPRHLFLELCQVLDRALLTLLTPKFDSPKDPDLTLNLALQTILGHEFANFSHRIPRTARHKIGFEIHCGDLLQDFVQTLSSFATLRQEGFKIAIDGVTPDMLNYINWARFDVDYIKINASKERAVMLNDPIIRQALLQIPKEKIIFFHCDSEQTLAMGMSLGITQFQGWLIDDKARAGRPR